LYFQYLNKKEHSANVWKDPEGVTHVIVFGGKRELTKEEKKKVALGTKFGQPATQEERKLAKLGYINDVFMLNTSNHIMCQFLSTHARNFSLDTNFCYWGSSFRQIQSFFGYCRGSTASDWRWNGWVHTFWRWKWLQSSYDRIQFLCIQFM
jgi:hypothetical protein